MERSELLHMERHGLMDFCPQLGYPKFTSLWGVQLGRYSDSLRAGRSEDRIPVGARFSARPDRLCGQPSLLYNGYRVFPGGKVRPGRAADHSPPSSAAVMEEQSYTSTHPLGHNRACNGITLPLSSHLIPNTGFSDRFFVIFLFFCRQ